MNVHSVWVFMAVTASRRFSTARAQAPVADKRDAILRAATEIFARAVSSCVGFSVCQPGSATECLRGEELTIQLTEPRNEPQKLALVATEPLTHNKEWVSLPEGEVIVFRKGSRTQ